MFPIQIVPWHCSANHDDFMEKTQYLQASALVDNNDGFSTEGSEIVEIELHRSSKTNFMLIRFTLSDLKKIITDYEEGR